MTTLKTALAATAIAALGTLATAQETPPGLTTSKEVRAEISEAMDAIGDYSAQQRDEALTRARYALQRFDAEIERREQVIRENWNAMSDEARETATETMQDLRSARNAVGESFGALQAGGADAWDELKTGLSDAWDALSTTWEKADEGNLG